MEAIARRNARQQLHRLRVAEWQTRTLALFIAQQAQVDVEKYGGKNPLVTQALGLSLIPDEEDELEQMRGEMTGYVSDEEGRKLMSDARRELNAAASGGKKGQLDSLIVDEEGNVVGVDMGVTPAGFTEEEFGAQATPGSFEGFMRMFGGGQGPGPR